MRRSAAARCSMPSNPNLLNTDDHSVHSARRPIRSTARGSFAYTSGGNIALNGWQVQISGTPAAGDTFTVQSNAGGTGDNTQCAGERQSANPGRAVERHDQRHRCGERADHRHRQPGAAGQHGADRADGGQHARRCTNVQSIVGRQSRRGGRQSLAVAAGLSGLGASADRSPTACSRLCWIRSTVRSRKENRHARHSRSRIRPSS